MLFFTLLSSPRADDTLMLVVLLSGLLLCAFLGRTSRRPGQDAEAGIVPGAVLSLSGLLIGFAFSIAVNGFAAREQAQVREALSAGRAWQYAGLLPDPARQTARQFLTAWMNDRIHFFREGTSEGGRNWMQLAQDRQNRLWQLMEKEATATPTPAVMSALATVSELGVSQQQTRAVWRRQIPDAAWCVLLLFALSASFLAGYRHPRERGMKRVLLFFPVLTALTLFMIAEIDIPGEGIIRVTPDDLEAMMSTLTGDKLPGAIQKPGDYIHHIP
ncbi:hypothetical protein G9387_06255 [Enterobacter hormaechei]|uniref:bestrophin-like domain n=1 Tax=Enterobacter hormaechei TaxID=158836 RepID=UPI0013EF5C6E|nr:hypothetical protein [Enterobacter hormaechei]KAF6706057.1 hypothetical protein G9393_07475 [Enterobacter hormaechei]KAF6712789.1 hypothetical protein G9387_06255 [Enterobacter hormaechei]